MIEKDYWKQMYLLAKNYFEKYGNLNIAKSFRTLDGIHYDKTGFELGKWLQKQKVDAGCGIPNGLSFKKIILLENIGIIWDRKLKNGHDWKYMYGILNNFYSKNGHLEIPLGYKTQNGLTEDEDGIDLGRWLIAIKKYYSEKILSDSKIKALEELNINWTIDREKKPLEKVQGTWKENYNLALVFFNHFGHSDIPLNFKTKDGIHEDPNGVALGLWFQKQRADYDSFIINKNDKKYNKLHAIKMVWYPEDNKKIIKAILTQCHLDTSFSSDLSRLPLTEVKAKMLYLIKNKISIIKDEKLNPIFFMSDKNIEVEYGITLEDIVNQYTLSKRK